MKTTLSRTVRAALVLGVLLAGSAPPIGARGDEPSWKDEFAEVCSKTQDAMALSAEELEALIARAEKLAPEIEKLGDAEKKVYARRFRACIELFRFVLESKKGAPAT